jgi:methionyl-tRNA synthetase
VVRKILQDLYDRGEIYKAEYAGHYCTPCERFFSKKDLLDGNLCPECRRPTDEIIESNYFFQMGKYQAWLIDYIQSHPEFIQPDFRRNETLGFLRKPLEDLCISRPKKRLAWGIELPFDKEYVCYVWFDALINYITGIGFGQDAAKFAKWWPASYHLIGKDILTTHTVYWPTMLKAMGIEQPKTIYAHGWWLIGADKMGKSAGNAVNPMEMAEKYGVDAFRYFLMSEMSLGNDASFTEDIFITRYNSNLANDLGNLLSRVVKMIVKEAGGIIPAPLESAQTEFEKELRETVLSAVFEMEPAITGMKLDRGLEQIMNAIRAANRYMEQSAPWKLAKEKNTDRLNTVLYTAAESLRIISGLLYPVMPGKMCEIRKAIGLPETGIEIFELKTWGKLSPGLKVSDIGSLFPRIEVNKTDTEKPAKSAETVAVAAEDMIAIDDFGKIKLRTAKVLEAEKVEGADKLLRLQIDVGGQKRQLVAGIALFYKPEEVVGRTIVIVANLKPAKIRGIESCGMLLAAKDGKNLKLITVDTGDFPAGASVG